ncbi:hypothetical protein ACQ4LE_007895 [Meloidogyne hapla]
MSAEQEQGNAPGQEQQPPVEEQPPQEAPPAEAPPAEEPAPVAEAPPAEASPAEAAPAEAPTDAPPVAEVEKLSLEEAAPPAEPAPEAAPPAEEAPAPEAAPPVEEVVPPPQEAPVTEAPPPPSEEAAAPPAPEAAPGVLNLIKALIKTNFQWRKLLPQKHLQLNAQLKFHQQQKLLLRVKHHHLLPLQKLSHPLLKLPFHLQRHPQLRSLQLLQKLLLRHLQKPHQLRHQPLQRHQLRNLPFLQKNQLPLLKL